MTTRSGIARTDDGVELRFWRHGPQAAPQRILLIHSLALDSGIWDPVVAGLLALPDLAVATFDCRGHGKSGTSGGSYAIERFADDGVAVLDALGWTSSIVTGASMGGSVSLALAARHPDRVSALGLVDTTGWYGPQAPTNWADRAEQARLEGLDSLVEFQLSRWFTDRFRAERRDVTTRFASVFVANDIEAYVRTCHMLGSLDLRAALPSLRMPTAIVVGDEDYATPPAMAEALAKAIGGATLELLPSARHLTPLERPAEVVRVIASLVDRAADA